MRVLMTSVTRINAFQTALAAYEGGFLKEFVTSIYYKPELLTYRLLHSLGSWAGWRRDLDRLSSHCQAGLPDSCVTPIAWPEVIEQLWRKSKLLGKIFPTDSVTYLKNEIFDYLVACRHMSSCDIFHSFEQGALFSLREAKKMGAVTVLDEPVIHRAVWDRLEASEREKLGIRAPKRPFWYHQHVERKVKELELADYIFVGLDFVKRSFADEGYSADRIFVIPYGVEISHSYQPIARPRRRTLQLLFVGQISWYKGLHYLLDAYDRLPLDEINLTIIGMVHSEWLNYFKERFACVRKPLRYLGTVPHGQMPDYYAQADIFVFPSLGGGVGFATYEAMATGLPVITSDGDVVIRDGIDGLVVSPQDTQGWIRALLRLAGDPELRCRLGAAAAKRVQAFTWKAYREGVIQAYQEISRREGLSARDAEPF